MWIVSYDMLSLDVKGQNIFVSEKCMWRLGDFGASRKFGDPIGDCAEVIYFLHVGMSLHLVPKTSSCALLWPFNLFALGHCQILITLFSKCYETTEDFYGSGSEGNLLFV